MTITKRKYTLEFRTEAAHRVIDTSRSVTEVAKELSIQRDTLGKWVRDERRHIEAAKATNSEPLSVSERTELLKLRHQVSEQEKDLAFLGKAAAYFAASPPKQKGLH